MSDARSIYISARPEGGSWHELGTIPLVLDDGLSSTGRFRYGDISVDVPRDMAVEPEASPVATSRPTATPTRTATRTVTPVPTAVASTPAGGGCLDSSPSRPDGVFRGIITLRDTGQPIRSGTVVEALVDGSVCAAAKVGQFGPPGNYALQFAARPGVEVRFRVGGHLVDDVATWAFGTPVVTDLVADRGSAEQVVPLPNDCSGLSDEIAVTPNHDNRRFELIDKWNRLGCSNSTPAPTTVPPVSVSTPVPAVTCDYAAVNAAVDGEQSAHESNQQAWDATCERNRDRDPGWHCGRRPGLFDRSAAFERYRLQICGQ